MLFSLRGVLNSDTVRVCPVAERETFTGWVRIQSPTESKQRQFTDLIREKKQRFEAIRGVRGIDQCVLHSPHDSNPACDCHTATAPEHRPCPMECENHRYQSAVWVGRNKTNFSSDTGKTATYSRRSEGCTVLISGFYILHTIPAQPVRDIRPGGDGVRLATHRQIGSSRAIAR